MSRSVALLVGTTLLLGAPSTALADHPTHPTPDPDPIEPIITLIQQAQAAPNPALAFLEGLGELGGER